MSEKLDLSFLDDPAVLETIFPLVYSPLYAGEYSPRFFPETADYFIKVGEGIELGCNFWVVSRDAPAILFFHGNGETASGYEPIAPLYNARGINLFVAGYRGYGASTGKPTVGNMFSDAHAVFAGFKQILEREGVAKRIFLMGRSLGSMSAIELGRGYPDEISGLIIESGSANNFRRLRQSLGAKATEALFGNDSPFLNKVKIRHIPKPTLIIHGECDELSPLSEAEELYRSAGAADKKLLVIPGAGHNDIMMVDEGLYFGGIKDFIESHRER